MSSPSSPSSPSPTQRLRSVLDAAVADRLLTPEQAREVYLRFAERGAGAVPDAGRRGRLAELAGYAGAALVLGAAALFLGTEWSGMTAGARAAVLGGAGVALAVAALLVLRTAGQPRAAVSADRDSARRRLVSTLGALAAAAVAGAGGVLAEGRVDEPLLVASAIGLAVAAAGYLAVPGAPGHVAAALAATVLTTSSVATAGPRVLDDGAHETAGPLAYGVALVVLGGVWTALTALRGLRERELGFALAGAVALLGAQLPVLLGGREWAGYLLTAAVAVGGYAGYLAARSWPVLAVGVLATTFVVPEALHDWTDGTVSVAGALLVAGLTLLAASAAGLRLRAAAR